MSMQVFRSGHAFTRLVLLILFLSAGPCAAATLLVNTDTLANASDGLCSLQEALISANNDMQPDNTPGECAPGDGADTIEFSDDFTIVLTGQMDNVTDTLEISGVGRNVVIDGADTFSIFRVVTNVALTINQLTLQNGRADNGPAVSNAGTLTVINSTFLDNTADRSGAGVYNSSDATISGSTFSGNFATLAGGAVFSIGTMVISNSTFFGNSTAGFGGAFGFAGTATVVNSTFSGNSADSSGGAIYVEGDLNLLNTVLADSPTGDDCFNALGDNIVTNVQNLIETNSAPGNQCGTPAISGDPMLDMLANNGGPTLTMSLLPGSPAIDTGDNATCSAAPVNNLDQRGEPRPFGSQCDLGAFEQIIQLYFEDSFEAIDPP